ncbi:MAG TPA: cyclic nucleotide-binding domain-containing protein [Sideroxyarcus sp.]|nr:cyclic nucleotide-binding domain-containing protein [Sideroxyarcus sp.]
MDDLDFTLPPTAPAKPAYDSGAARSFFALQGEEVRAAAGETIFAEDEKGSRLFLQRDKMYLLLEGEVELSVKRQPIGKVAAGEIFGELASITQTARSATATAKTACRFMSLDDKQFLLSLRAQPEFALTLMGIIVDRLRVTLDRMEGVAVPGREGRAFDKGLLAELLEELGDSARMRFPAGKVIMEQGQTGVLMYVVLEGSVQIRIGDTVVERVGPGGMFGEMALVGRTQRLAGAVAETGCELLPVNRNVFVDLVKTNPKFGLAMLVAVGERARHMAAARA